VEGAENVDATSVADRPRPNGADPVFASFAALWAIATLFHVGSYGIWRTSVPVALAAAWLLARPSSLPRLLLFAAVQIGDAWSHSPWIPNHWLFTAFANLTLLLAWAAQAARRRSLAVEGGALLRCAAPALRAQVLLLYGFAFFHKLNRDFLSPQVSCAAELYDWQLAALPFLPQGQAFRAAAIHATLALELAIPLLLALRRTRGAGVLLGLLFHGLLALNPLSGFYNFSAMLVALYVVFRLEALETGDLRKLWRWLPTGGLADAASRRPGLALLASGTALAAALFFALRETPEPLRSRSVFLALWILYWGGILVAFAALRLGSEPARSALPAQWPRLAPALLLPVLLVFLNGACPYLGLKTETSFSMFSNLRTEGGRTNHLLAPTSLQLFAFQRDLVEVMDASDAALRARGRAGKRIAFFELRDWLSRHPDSSVSFVRGSQRSDLARAGDDPRFATPTPVWLRKLLRFRDVDEAERQSCAH
jgi:hypothetical protein